MNYQFFIERQIFEEIQDLDQFDNKNNLIISVKINHSPQDFAFNFTFNFNSILFLNLNNN